MKPEHKPIFDALTEPELMGLCIYFEARGEPPRGKAGVGGVILNRVNAGGWFGKTIREVITKPWQFSWLNSIPPQSVQDPQYELAVEIAGDFANRRKLDEALDNCCGTAERLISGKCPVQVKSTHYMTGALYRSDKCPEWARKMKVHREWGNHVFLI